MFRRLRFTVALGLAAVCAGPLRADDAAQKTYEVEVQSDIAYRTDKDADPTKHKLDIYTPKGQKDFPVMMFVHGGAWRSGNKGLYQPLGKTFAKQGIGVAIINYRLSGKESKVKHPDHVKDVAGAFAWVHANIGKYGGRNDRIFLCGHSAGAHLVALLATDECYLKEHKLGLQDIRGVMPLSGVFEITASFPPFNGPFGTEPETCKAASPINHIKEKHPPFLICYADKDIRTIDKMSEDFCKKLTDGKCEARSLKIDSRDHYTIIIQLATDPEDPCSKAMLDFIAKHSEWKRPI
jgi:dipeptidyl aminopeptidase/acylaminoacyl peptidase